MGNPLLQRASPQEFAARRQVIEKKEELQLFPRLAEVVNTDLQALLPDRVPDKWRQAPVAIRLAFGWMGTEHDKCAARIDRAAPAVERRNKWWRAIVIVQWRQQWLYKKVVRHLRGAACGDRTIN